MKKLYVVKLDENNYFYNASLHAGACLPTLHLKMGGILQ